MGSPPAAKNAAHLQRLAIRAELLLLSDAASAQAVSLDQFLVDHQRGFADDGGPQRLRGQRRRRLHKPRRSAAAVMEVGAARRRGRAGQLGRRGRHGLDSPSRQREEDVRGHRQRGQRRDLLRQHGQAERHQRRLLVTYCSARNTSIPTPIIPGTDPGDDAAALVGDNENVARWTFLPPLRDSGGYAAPLAIRHAHPSGFSMALCDGSVKLIDFGIDPDIHRSMGNRKDGLPAENPLP